MADKFSSIAGSLCFLTLFKRAALFVGVVIVEDGEDGAEGWTGESDCCCAPEESNEGSEARRIPPPTPGKEEDTPVAKRLNMRYIEAEMLDREERLVPVKEETMCSLVSLFQGTC